MDALRIKKKSICITSDDDFERFLALFLRILIQKEIEFEGHMQYKPLDQVTFIIKNRAVFNLLYKMGLQNGAFAFCLQMLG